MLGGAIGFAPRNGSTWGGGGASENAQTCNSAPPTALNSSDWPSQGVTPSKTLQKTMQSCLNHLPSRFALLRPFQSRTLQATSTSSCIRCFSRSMATVKTDHSQRTAHEPRDPVRKISSIEHLCTITMPVVHQLTHVKSLNKVILSQIDEINPTIRTFRLSIPPGGSTVRFLPGQWLDVFAPGIPKPGGFTITSPPSKARLSSSAAPSADAAAAPSSPLPYLELAIQNSPANVVANWFWQPPAAILNAEIWIRVGGSFVWPPPGLVPMVSFAPCSRHHQRKKLVLLILLPRSLSLLASPRARHRTLESWTLSPRPASNSAVMTLGTRHPPDRPVSISIHPSFLPWLCHRKTQGTDQTIQTLRKIIFLAGGVGINPLMSIVSHLAERSQLVPSQVAIDFLYSVRNSDTTPEPSKILFLERLAGIFGRCHDGAAPKVRGELQLFLTGGGAGGGHEGKDGRIDDGVVDLPFKRRRVAIEDVAEAVGDDKRSVVVYVCGVPKMTDEVVEKLISPKGLGLEPHRVLYEKWW